MRATILVGCALFAGCATPPEPASQGDTIPINAAPAPGELKVEHHRFSDDVIPGAFVDRSGYTPTIMISDPTLRTSSPNDQVRTSLGRSEARDEVAKSHLTKGTLGASLEVGVRSDVGSARICPSSRNDCVLAELFFGLDQSELTGAGASVVDSINVAGKSLELIGYADAVGEKDYNGKLALARAQSVREALIAAGAKEVVVRAGHEAKFAGSKFRKVIIVGL